jgi:hypothetical protein
METKNESIVKELYQCKSTKVQLNIPSAVNVRWEASLASRVACFLRIGQTQVGACVKEKRYP